jgi:hypothetical protein
MISMHDYLIQGNPRIPRSPFRHIIHLRDGAHTVNLTVKTILLDPTAKRLMKQLEKTIVVIKAAKRLRVRLSANQTEKKLRLVEPTDTRWNSQHAAMSRFLKLRTPLMAALNADDGDEKCSNRHLVHTDEWWRSAGELKTLLYPFLSAINHLQSDDVSLHTYNRMIEFCRDSLIKAAHPIPPAVANSMTAAAALGLTKYNSLRWKPINNGAQPRQFVRMLFLHLNHGLNGSPRIVWIKPTRIMDNSVSDEYVERQRVADEKSDEATSARIVQWYVCWAADYLINTGDACVGANYPTDGESLKILQNRIYDQWLSFVSRQKAGWRTVYTIYASTVTASQRAAASTASSTNANAGAGIASDMCEEQAAIRAFSSIMSDVEFALTCKVLLQIIPSEAAVERSFSQEKLVQTPLRNRLNSSAIDVEMQLRFNRVALAKTERPLVNTRELHEDEPDDPEALISYELEEARAAAAEQRTELAATSQNDFD